MIKFYKNTSKGGNGEMVIQTDAKTLEDFTREFADAIVTFVGRRVNTKEDYDDLEYAMGYLIPCAFQLALKLAGYKTVHVRKSRILTCGHYSPTECILIHES